MATGTISGSMELVGGTVYTINNNVTIQADAGKSALTVKSGSGAAGKCVVIDIPAGKELKVTGGNASGTTGAGAGIALPEDMTLYITGSGSLVAAGGKASDGGNGSSGSSASRNSDMHSSGSGGSGGNGGGGAGAGIGGAGGQGGSGGSGGSNESNVHSTGDTFARDGNAGASASGAATGGKCGRVIILGDVKVSVSGGSAGKAGGSGGYGGNASEFATDDWFSGGGGPGGAGGGGGAAQSIGGGGGGGGAGGGGGSGSFVEVDSAKKDLPEDQRWKLHGGKGGSGGGGSDLGGGSKGTGESIGKLTNEGRQKHGPSTSGKGGDGTEGGARGGTDNLYVLPSTGYAASPYRASDKIQLASLPEIVTVTVTFDSGLKDGNSSNNKTVTYNQAFGRKTAELPDAARVTRAGYRFAGYWTTSAGDGTCVYGPDYKPTMLLSPYPQNFTLYARWEIDSSILSVTASGDGASTLDVYGNEAITLRDAVNALTNYPGLVGTDGRRRVTFEKLDATNRVIHLASEIEIPADVRSFEINGLCELEPGAKGVEIVAGPNSRHLNYAGKSSDGGMFSLASLNFTGGSGMQGGSIRVTGEASLSIDTCSFIGNTSPGTNSGGAIAVLSSGKGAELFVTSSTFAGNSAPDRHGGALLVSGGYALFVNTTFTGNSVPGSGGAILEMGGGRIDAVNCTFAKNSSGSNSAIHSADSKAVIRAVNCIFADSAAVSMSGGTKNLYWCSENVASSKVFTNGGAAIMEVVAGVTHMFHPPLGGAAAGNEDAAEIYCDPGYENIRAVGRDGTTVTLIGHPDKAKIPFVVDQIAAVRTAPTRGAIRLAVGTEPVTVELDGVLYNPDGTPKANEDVGTSVIVSYSDGATATNMTIRTADYGVFGLSVPVDGSDGLSHNVTAVTVDALGSDPIAVTMAPYALSAASVDLLGSNDYLPLYGEAIAIGNVAAGSISVTNSFDARAAGTFTAGELKGFGEIDLEKVDISGGTLDWLGGAKPAANSDAFADLAEMTIGGGADMDSVGTISDTKPRTWKAANDGFMQLQAQCRNPKGTTLKLDLLDSNGAVAAEVTPEGTLGNSSASRRFIWTVPVRKDDTVRLTMSAGELTLVKAQFIYFGVAE